MRGAGRWAGWWGVAFEVAGGAGGVDGEGGDCRLGGERGGEGLEEDAVAGDEAVVEDVLDVGLGGETLDGGGIVCAGVGLEGGDAEALIAMNEMGAEGAGAELGVAGNSGVAVDDEVSVGKDGLGWDCCL